MNTDLVFRAGIFLILLAATGMSGWYWNRARKEGGQTRRQDDGRLALALRLGFTLPLLADLLLNIIYPPLLLWAHFTSPLYLKIIGLVLALACIPLLWWVFRSIGGNISETVLTKESHELVTSGPYARVRHPLYATALLLFFGCGLVFGDWIILGYCLAGLLAFRLLVIPAEEEELLETFGEEYECYQARTGALFPWLR